MIYPLTNISLRLITLVVRFGLIFLLAAFLEPAEVGLYGLITVTVSYSLYFVGFDFYTFSTRDLLGKSKKEWPSLLTSQGAFFILLYLVILPSSLIIYMLGLLPWWTAVWILPLIVTEHLSQEFNRLIVAMGNPLRASALIFVRQGVWPILFIGLVFSNDSYRNLETLLFLWVLGSSLCVLASAVILKRLDWSKKQQINRHWIRRGVKIALPLLIATLALRGIFTVDRYMFKALNGTAILGAYTVYMGVASVMLTFMDAAVFVFHYPKMIEQFKSGNINAFRKSYKKLFVQTLLWLPLLLIGAAICGPITFGFLPKEIYMQYLPLFFGVLVAIALIVLSMIPHYGLYATSNDRHIIIAHIFGFIIFCGVALLMSYYSHLWSVTVAMMAAAIFILGYKFITYRNVSRAVFIDTP